MTRSWRTPQTRWFRMGTSECTLECVRAEAMTRPKGRAVISGLIAKVKAGLRGRKEVALRAATCEVWNALKLEVASSSSCAHT